MPTFLEQFADAEIKVRYKEPLLTAAFDEMLTGLAPRGIHRGFRLGSIASPNVTIEADPDEGDHLGAYTTLDGYTLRLRRTGGNFTLDLSSLLGANKTWVIAIFAEYATGVTTAAEIRAYELSPVDEFTGTAERGELIVLGTVTEVAGVLTSSAPTYRTGAWLTQPKDSREWVQVVKNGDFSVMPNTALTPAEWAPYWTTAGLNTYSWEISRLDPYVGDQHLAVIGGGTGTDNMNSLETVKIRGGSYIHAMYAIKGVAWGGVGANGNQGLQVIFYTEDGVYLSVQYVTNNALSGNFGWVEVEKIIQAPANAAFMRYGIWLDDNGAAPTGDLYFDAVRIFVEADQVDEGHDPGSTRDELVQAIALDLVPTSSAYTTIEQFVERTLRLWAINTAEPFQYWWQHLHGEKEWDLYLKGGGIDIDRLIRAIGANLIGNDTDGARARITTPIDDASTVKYVQLWHVPNAAAGESMRIYATQSTAVKSTDTISLVLNAYWNPSTSQWEREVAADAIRIDVYKSGFALYHRDSTDASPWVDTDWDNPQENRWMDFRDRGIAPDPIRAVLDLYADIDLNGKIENLGESYIDTADRAQKPRIEGRQAANSVHAPNYTLLWEVTSLDSIPHPRLYASGNGGVLHGAGFVITINAEWDPGTDTWSRDVSGTPSILFVFDANGITMYTRASTSADGWGLLDWFYEPLFDVVPFTDVDSNDGLVATLTDGKLNLQDVTHATNPLKDVNPVSNTLYAKNVVKAWGNIRCTATTPTLDAGFGIDETTLAYNGQLIEFDLFDSMDPEHGGAGATKYAVLVGADGVGTTWGHGKGQIVDQNSIQLALYRESAGTVVRVDLDGNAYIFFVLVIGEQ